MLAISHAMQASVGNSIAKESVEKNRNDLKILNFLFMYIVGFCTICLACLYQPFMRIWMNNNESMMLSEYNMLLFCIYFYAINTNNIRNLYVNGCGLYYECRIWFVVEALGNLILNFTLGYFFGVTGILLATIVTIILFNFILRTNVLFKNYFNETAFDFYKEHLFYLSVTIIAGLITYLTVNFISVPGIGGFILKMICTCVLSNLIYLIAYYRTDIFKDSASFIKDRVLLRH